MRVKICGITSLDEAKMCLSMGADALGFLVGITHSAEDKIAHHDACEIIKKLPPFVSTVAVTHLTDADEVIDLCKYLNVTTVQIHNTMSIANVKKVRDALPMVKIIKNFHVDKQLSIESIKEFRGIVDAILLDTRTEDRLGGTGITHDWTISSKIAKEVDLPIILAGGLNPDNLRDAIDGISPLYGVDVNSGVETAGKKDKHKVGRFVEIAKGFTQ